MARDVKAAVETLQALLRKYGMSKTAAKTGERAVAFAISERADEMMQTELKSFLGGWSATELLELEDAWEKAAGEEG